LMHDLVTLGEILLRLSVPSPGLIENARQLDVQIGGAEANVAAACARLGLRVAWISAIPDNDWGNRVRRELSGHGVDCAYITSLEGTRLGAYYLEYGAAPRPIRVLYDRRDSAFTYLTVDMVDWEPVRRARLAHVSGVTPALGGHAQSLTRRFIEAGSTISFDLNYRSALWRPEEAHQFALSVLPRVRYFFLGQTEAQTVFGHNGLPETILERLTRVAPKATIALLQGQEGSTVLHEGKLWRPSIRPNVKVVDPIGAGDAWVAGYLWAMLQGREIQDAVDTGAIVAALKCSTWGDIALITERDVNEVRTGGPDVRR
jgi:2-dehydro-3-deoxygluconokinase